MSTVLSVVEKVVDLFQTVNGNVVFDINRLVVLEEKQERSSVTMGGATFNGAPEFFAFVFERVPSPTSAYSTPSTAGVSLIFATRLLATFKLVSYSFASKILDPVPLLCRSYAITANDSVMLASTRSLQLS